MDIISNLETTDTPAQKKSPFSYIRDRVHNEPIQIETEKLLSKGVIEETIHDIDEFILSFSLCQILDLQL